MAEYSIEHVARIHLTLSIGEAKTIVYALEERAKNRDLPPECKTAEMARVVRAAILATRGEA